MRELEISCGTIRVHGTPGNGRPAFIAGPIHMEKRPRTSTIHSPIDVFGPVRVGGSTEFFL